MACLLSKCNNINQVHTVNVGETCEMNGSNRLNGIGLSIKYFSLKLVFLQIFYTCNLFVISACSFKKELSVP